MASEATIEKYTAVHRRMQHRRKKPVNDGSVRSFSDYVEFLGSAESSNLDAILGEGVDIAVRANFVRRQETEQGASDGVEAETDTSG